MYPLFSERKKKQWENTFTEKKKCFIRFALVNHFYYTQNVYKKKTGNIFNWGKSIARVTNVLIVQTKYNI